MQQGYKAQRRRRRKNRKVRIAWLAALILISFAAGRLTGGKEKSSPAPKTAVPVSNMAADDSELTFSSETEPDTEVPKVDKNAWSLILVNAWNPIPDDYEVTTVEMIRGQAANERCYPALQEMMDDCKAAGLEPVICASYRTYEKQEALFNEQVNECLAQGYSYAQAKREAGKAVAVPGTSEHQLGLAFDIVDASYQILDEGQETTAVQQWLMKNSWKYGFILRYPNQKSDITGIIYEPWHYRYVGKEAAKEIYDAGLCLEEYLQQ